jgi:hypothetical protein
MPRAGARDELRDILKQILAAVEERKTINDLSTNYNPKITFRFFVKIPYDEEVVINILLFNIDDDRICTEI